MKIKYIAVTCIALSTSFCLATKSAHSQEFTGEQASDWCKQVLKEEFPAKLAIGNIDNTQFKLKTASCRHIGAKKHCQLLLEGGGPKMYFDLLETDIEGKSFVLPCQKKLSDGIYYSSADMYPASGNQIALHSREYCARLSFSKKRKDGLIPGYILFRAESVRGKFKQSSIAGYFYAALN